MLEALTTLNFVEEPPSRKWALAALETRVKEKLRQRWAVNGVLYTTNCWMKQPSVQVRCIIDFRILGRK
jgi:hypothetical protein